MRYLTAKERRELAAKAAAEARRNMPKPTNADLIRAMSDEELAKIIMCPYDKGDNSDCEKTCTQCCHDWLTQPAEEAKQYCESGRAAEAALSGRGREE